MSESKVDLTETSEKNRYQSKDSQQTIIQSNTFTLKPSDQLESERAVRHALKLANSINSSKFNLFQHGSQQTKEVFFSPQHKLSQNDEFQGQSMSRNNSKRASVEVDVHMILKHMCQHKLRFSNGKTLDLTQTGLIGSSKPSQAIPSGYLQETFKQGSPHSATKIKNTFGADKKSERSNGNLTKFQFQSRRSSQVGQFQSPPPKSLPGLADLNLQLNTISSTGLILPQLSNKLNLERNFSLDTRLTQTKQNLRQDFPMRRVDSSDLFNSDDQSVVFQGSQNYQSEWKRDVVASSRDHVSKLVQKSIWKVAAQDKLLKKDNQRVTINQFAENTYNNKQMLASSASDEESSNQMHSDKKISVQKEMIPDEEITVHQMMEMKRQRKKEKEIKRREMERQRYEDKKKMGLIVPLTKDESAAKIKFFTLAMEQRAKEREAEQHRLLHPEQYLNDTNAFGSNNEKSPMRKQSLLLKDISSGLKINKMPESPSNVTVSSQHPSVIYADKTNPNFKFRLPKIPSDTRDIFQNTMHSFFSKDDTQQGKAFQKSKTKLMKTVTTLTDSQHEEEEEDDKVDGQKDEEETPDRMTEEMNETAQKPKKGDDKNLALQKIIEEEKEAEEQLEICGEDFFYAISNMIQDFDIDGIQKQPNYGNKTSVSSIFQKTSSNIFQNTDSFKNIEKLLNSNVDSDIPQIAIQGFINLIKGQNTFYRKAKKAQESKFSESIINDAKLSYFNECEKNQVLCTPYLHKIIDNKLVLRSRTINEGLCKAIKVVLTLAPNLLRSLTLDQNGMDPDEMIQMLYGVSNQSGNFKSLTIQDNFLDDECTQVIIDLVKRKIPENLEELHLYFCKIGWKETDTLCQEMKVRNHLSSLSLVQAQLNEFSVPYLAAVVQNQKRLVYLDISWNSLVPKSLKPLLLVIAKNRRLQNINLGWNNIAIQQQSEKEQKEIAELLGEVIKHNKKLIHFDLTCTGLTQLIIVELGNIIRRAGTLLSIHLSGNPGLTTENKKGLVDRIHCRPNEDTMRFMKIQSMIQKETKSMPRNYVDGIMDNLKRGQRFDKRDFNPIDQLVLQRIIGFKQQQPGIAQWFESSPEACPTKRHYKGECWICAKHIYSIILWSRGRAIRIKPILNQQQSSQICYEIDQSYQFDGISDSNPGTGYDRGNLPYDQLEDRVPYIAASFTGWRYKKMIPLHEFTMSIDKDYLEPFEVAKNEAVVRRRIQLNEMTPMEVAQLKVVEAMERQRYRVQWANFFKYLEYKIPYIINGSFFESINDNSDILDKYSSSVIQTIGIGLSDSEKELVVVEKPKKKEKKRNADGETEPEPEVLPVPPDESKWDIVYCLPFFAKPGKHNYMVKFKNSQEKRQKAQLRQLKRLQEKMNSQETEDSKYEQYIQDIEQELQAEKFFYNCRVVERTEPIPIIAKQIKSNIVQRQFNKETSVFKMWIKDTPQRTIDIIEHDFNFWKLPRLITKNPETDIPACKELLLKHAEFIKECFINLISQSSYPAITKNEFGSWCNKTKIQETAVNISTVDRCFIAANTSQEAKFCTIGGALCRYEFLEVLVRLAQQKYLNQGLAKTFAESLEKLFDERILPLAQSDSWQDWRDKELWTIPVNDIFEANLEEIRKIYTTYQTTTKPQLCYEDIITMCTKDAELNCPTQDLHFCWGMSKMSVVSESLNYKQYSSMSFVEFLEFIGRIANIKFKSSPVITSQSLAQKIEYVLDDLMPAFGLVRNEVTIAVEENSESDDDY